eukprot:768636-Hanusia_phi.AAC.2
MDSTCCIGSTACRKRGDLLLPQGAQTTKGPGGRRPCQDLLINVCHVVARQGDYKRAGCNMQW